MYDTVLVPTDGSDHSLRAAEHGSALARAFDARLHVVSVVDRRLEKGPLSFGELREEIREELRADSRRAIERVEEVLEDPTGVQTAVLEGAPVDEILGYAAEHAIDLVTMGTQGRTGLDRYVAGSVAEGVVRRADVPVLTVRATDWSRGVDAYESILVPTDGSEFADVAVGPALAIAERFDAHVHVLHVVDVRSVAASGGYTPPSEVLENFRSLGQAAVEDIAARARDAGLAVTTHVLEGMPAAGVLDCAEDADVDAIAMATAGRTGLNRFLLGSTTERVIRHADVPVLAVGAREGGPD